MNKPKLSSTNIIFALLTAAVLWSLALVFRSLWIDEFHTLEHARAVGFSGFLDSLATGNHPPMAFLLLRWSIQCFGESHFSMRWWSVAVGLGVLVLGARLARSLPASGGRFLPWLIALSSFALLIHTEARMYGLQALAVLGVLGTVVRSLEGRGNTWGLSLWIALGLHAHYYFVHYLFVLGLLTIGVAILRPETRNGFVRLILPSLLGLVLFFPWGLTGFWAQLQHDRPSGGSLGLYLNLQGYAQSIAHFLFINASAGGKWMSYGVALPGAAAGGLLGLLGAWRLWRARREGGLFFAYVLAASLLVPAWSFLFASLWDRAGYNWRYIAGSCVPTLMLIACGMGFGHWLRAIATSVLVACMAIVTVFCAVTPGQEDFWGAVRHIVHNAQPGDAVVTNPMREVRPDWGPTGWDFYRTRIDRPTDAVDPQEYRVHRYQGALAHDRVWVFRRYWFPGEVLQALEEEYRTHTVMQMSPVIKVDLFTR